MNLIASELSSIKDQGFYRNLSTLSGIDFCTNDYLGFIQAGKISSINLSYEKGAGSSRLIPGHHQKMFEGEAFLAEVYSADSVLFFGSGYLANMGVLQAFSHEESDFFSDELNHASIIDGMRLAKGKKSIYPHNDLNALDEMLKMSHYKQKIVVTESVFSMDGDSPNLKELIRICERYNAFLIIDEAHATGVAGENGLGLMEGLHFDKDMTVIVHTCGKALGSYGAFVTSGKLVRELLINKARTLIYSTALPPFIVEQICSAVSTVKLSGQERLRIIENIHYAKEQFKKINLELKGSHVGYFKILNAENSVMHVEENLKKQGIEVKAIRFPSVSKGEERIRITLKSFNTKVEIQALTTYLKEFLK